MPNPRSHDNAARQVVTEAVLVSGVYPYAGRDIDVTLSASRVVGAPLYLSGEAAQAGDSLRFTVRQSGVGSFALTWNAVYKAAGIAETAASATAVDTVEFVFDGTNWNASETLMGEVA